MNTETHAPTGLKKWLPLVVLGMAVLIIVIDTTLLNVSLGTIIRELHTNIQAIQWVITAYALTLAALTITGGRLGDLFGRKRLFMAGAVIFAAGSLLASLSHSVGMLLIGESIIEGIGAALMLPATSSLLVATYKGHDRATALGVWGGMAAVGSAIGPVVGGFLTSHYSWRWGFRINVFVAALLLIGSVVIKDSHDLEEKPTIDFVGVLLSSFGLLAGVFAIIEGAQYGWLHAQKIFTVAGHAISFGSVSIVPVMLALSVVLLSLFVAWEQSMVRRNKTPLVSMKLFKNKQFTSGAVTTMIMSLGQVGLLFAVPVFLQSVHGLDALHTGYGLLPLSVGLLVAAPFSGAVLSKKFTPKRIIQVALVLDVAALILIRFSMSVHSSALSLLPGLALYGIGMGLGMAQISNLTLSAVSVNEAGEASGVNNTMRQIGSSLGSAIVGAVLLTTLSGHLTSGISNSPVIPSSQRASIAQEVSAQSSAVEFGGKLQTVQTLNPAEKQEIKSLSDTSTTSASQTAILYTVVFMALAFVASTQLPGGKHIEHNESVAGPPAAH
ncbi:MAG: hypothetical protein JWO47_309 [Candidatus Saccharibacteria bacterium]|nr:hypothetical protein [Candidatus Saccharibacteria bacterium]